MVSVSASLRPVDCDLVVRASERAAVSIAGETANLPRQFGIYSRLEEGERNDKQQRWRVHRERASGAQGRLRTCPKTMNQSRTGYAGIYGAVPRMSRSGNHPLASGTGGASSTSREPPRPFLLNPSSRPPPFPPRLHHDSTTWRNVVQAPPTPASPPSLAPFPPPLRSPLAASFCILSLLVLTW